MDTDALSHLPFNEERADEFEELVQGHELFIASVTRAEVETLLRLSVLDEDHTDALREALERYSPLELSMGAVVDQWAAIRAATRHTTSRNNRERRQYEDSVLRVEDARLLTGDGRYVADLPPGQVDPSALVGHGGARALSGPGPVVQASCCSVTPSSSGVPPI